MELYIDDREDNERIDAIKNEFNSNVEVRRLLTGDILIYQNDGPIICIETKTIQDFIQSCRNRQIQKEALNMKKLYAFSYIIIYDDGKMNAQYVKPLTLNEKYGNIVSLMQRYKVPVNVITLIIFLSVLKQLYQMLINLMNPLNNLLCEKRILMK